MPTEDGPKPPERAPDAITFPAGYLAGTGFERLPAASKLFGPVLGCRSVDVRAEGSWNFARPYVAPKRHDTPGAGMPQYVYEATHPLAGEDRYDWFVATPRRGGGWGLGAACAGLYDRAAEEVRFGYLREEPAAAASGDIHAILAARAAEEAGAKAAPAPAAKSSAVASGPDRPPAQVAPSGLPGADRAKAPAPPKES